MVEDDTFTYHGKPQPRVNINTAQATTSVHALITRERTQKLDLLLHLLSNLTQSLVVCGPEGIGKTMLLTLLQERNTELFRYCLIQANDNVSFEAIQEQLAHTLSDKSVPSLSAALSQYESQHKQVVLIVDNAGELVPGLIYAIIQYAAANPVLRVIFSLTHDELQLKRGSDKAIDDCHIVEIPTLSEKQCGDFLQQLSARPALNLSFKAISENMIAHIYCETHGVPGRIIAELSGKPSRKHGGALKWTLALIVSGAIAVAIGLQWQPWQHINKKIPVAVVEQKTDIAHIAAQKVETPIPLTLPPAQPVPVLETTLLDASEQKPNQSEDRSLAKIVEEQAASVLEFKDQIEPMNAVPLEQKPEIKPVEVPEKKIIEPPVAQPEKPKPAELKAIVKPEKSVLASANNFTLQLMVLSKQASVNSMLKKYPAMAAGVRTIKVLANGQEKFVLEYGAYPDAVSASKARQSLPAEFHNAMVKKQGAR
jgi:DamX protein